MLSLRILPSEPLPRRGGDEKRNDGARIRTTDHSAERHYEMMLNDNYANANTNGIYACRLKELSFVGNGKNTWKGILSIKVKERIFFRSKVYIKYKKITKCSKAPSSIWLI